MIAEELDPGIRRYVESFPRPGTTRKRIVGTGKAWVLRTAGVETFYGQRGEGFRALAVALAHAFPVSDLRRVWSIEDGEPVGPNWELTFS